MTYTADDQKSNVRIIKDIKIIEFATSFEDGKKLAYEIIKEVDNGYQIRLDLDGTVVTELFLIGLFKTLLSNYTTDELRQYMIYKKMPKCVLGNKDSLIRSLVDEKLC